jgi:hypothetical protein
MAAVTRPKRIGCCDTPCFTTREEKVLAGVKAPAGRPRNGKERLDHAGQYQTLFALTSQHIYKMTEKGMIPVRQVEDVVSLPERRQGDYEFLQMENSGPTFK